MQNPAVPHAQDDPSPTRGLPSPPHMTSASFREQGHRMIEWIADYMEALPDRPVREPVGPGDIARMLPGTFSEVAGDEGEWDRITRDLDEIVVPGLTHWQHPRFFGYFPCNASAPAVLGELVSAGINVNGMLWATSPAATEIESRMLEWCRTLFGLPDRFAGPEPSASASTPGGTAAGSSGGGSIQGTASESTLLAMLAARRQYRDALAARSPDGSTASTQRQEVRVLTSEQAHSSVIKAAMIAGIADGPDDTEHVCLVPTDDAYRMDPGALLAELTRPDALPTIMVTATMGTTATGAFDPIDVIAGAISDAVSASREAGAAAAGNTAGTARPWLHVDAAWAGAALVCPELRSIGEGLNTADSICINPHKWMLTNFDCDLFWVADRKPLIDALSITPEYLRTAESEAGAVVDYR
ncbi:MAG: pyridoxal-dependent decarboxylase, partial [Planctomycetota bacterium]